MKFSRKSFQQTIFFFSIITLIAGSGCTRGRSTLKPANSDLPLADSFLSISSVNPSSGPLAGGNQIDVFGTGFQSGASASIGTQSCSSGTIVSDTQIRCTVPASTIAGLMSISVTNPDGDSTELTEAYTYLATAGYPEIAAVSPNLGPKAGGTVISVTGGNFVNGATVYVNGVLCNNIVFVSASELRCSTPASNGGGVVNITVVNPGGFETVRNAAFSFYSPVQGGVGVAFQANTTEMWLARASGNGTLGYGMAPGTSPSIVRTASGDVAIAFQSNVGELWVVGAYNLGNTHLGMMPGTSPSIVQLADGSFQVAFQANTTHLWLIGKHNIGDTGLGMAAKSSPSLAALRTGHFRVAFQANTTHLWMYGSDQPAVDMGLGMMSETSPAIVGLSNGGYEIAFQANTTVLWLVGDYNYNNTGYGMMPGTSPALVATADNNFQVAFQANTTKLWTVGPLATKDTGLGMAPGTSPSIALDGGGYQISFQANTGRLWLSGSQGNYDTGLGLMGSTSPAIY